MKVRLFQERDEEQVKNLVTSIMKGEHSEEESAYPENDLNEISVVYGGRKDVFIVAEEEDKIIGTVAIKQESDDVALLRRLFVNPQYRGRGHGLSLLNEAVNFCKQHHYRVINLRSTDRMKQAIELCKKKGFVERSRVNFGPFQIVKLTLSI